MSRLATILAAAACALAVFAATLGTGAGAPAGEPTSAARATDVPKPKTAWDPIPYGKGRKRQMANYSHRHYGDRTWRLRNPKVIVLHYTATATYGPVHNAFAANTPSLGEKPGVCSQFVVDKDGTIHQLTRLNTRCRHTIGLNQTSIGIEMVQEGRSGKHGADRAILGRKKQIRAATKLTAWLKQRYRIGMRNVIGHSMANDSRYFKDLEGWRNDHVDWLRGDVRKYRKIVAKVIRKHR
jgi:hypothetical protein